MTASEALQTEVLSTDECRASTGVDTPHRQRNQNLDALRAVAVLMVIGCHLPTIPIWARAGWAGVDLFFVLSGFLISDLLFREWRATGSICILRFYARRAFKIYPAFWALALVTFAAVPHKVTATRAAADMLFVQNYFSGVPLLSHTWSLAVEEHFYIVLPLLLWIMQRKRSVDPFRELQPLLLAVATIALFLRFAASDGGYLFRTYFETHLRMDGLMTGVLLGYYRNFRPDIFARIRHSRAGLSLAAFSLVLLATVELENPLMHTVGFTLLYLAFGVLLARMIDARPLQYTGWLLNGLSLVGRYSYSIYLWHFAVSRTAPVGKPGDFAAYVAVSIMLGIMMAKIVECPVLKARERWLPSVQLSNPSEINWTASAAPAAPARTALHRANVV